MALPSGFTSKIKSIDMLGEAREHAHPPESVCIRLEDELDVSRGDMLCRPHNQPTMAQNVDAMVCWMTEKPMTEGQRLAVKHTTRETRGIVKDLQYRININTLHRELDATELGLNDIGRITLRCAQPLLFDPYRRCRTTGSFILIDEGTNNTVGVGMITGEADQV